MPDVAPTGSERKFLPTMARARVRAERPPACRVCNAPAWWNGWRVVFPVVRDAVAGLVRCEWPLPRARCPACDVSFTCYPAELYPRRPYVLDVVALVVAAVVVGGRSFARAARGAEASTTSARRWTRWVAALAAPGELLALTARVEPDALAGTGASVCDPSPTIRGRAARVLAALESLGAALVRRGVACAECSGLGRVLGWQHRAHGDVVQLTRPPERLSPAMALWQEAALG
ncbi:MAG: hypothetical protein ACREAZ_12615 [Nitrososphaera sp.]